MPNTLRHQLTVALDEQAVLTTLAENLQRRVAALIEERDLARVQVEHLTAQVEDLTAECNLVGRDLAETRAENQDRGIRLEAAIAAKRLALGIAKAVLLDPRVEAALTELAADTGSALNRMEARVEAVEKRLAGSGAMPPLGRRLLDQLPVPADCQHGGRADRCCVFRSQWNPCSKRLAQGFREVLASTTQREP